MLKSISTEKLEKWFFVLNGLFYIPLYGHFSNEHFNPTHLIFLSLNFLFFSFSDFISILLVLIFSSQLLFQPLSFQIERIFYFLTLLNLSSFIRSKLLNNIVVVIFFVGPFYYHYLSYEYFLSYLVFLFLNYMIRANRKIYSFSRRQSNLNSKLFCIGFLFFFKFFFIYSNTNKAKTTYHFLFYHEFQSIIISCTLTLFFSFLAIYIFIIVKYDGENKNKVYFSYTIIAFSIVITLLIFYKNLWNQLVVLAFFQSKKILFYWAIVLVAFMSIYYIYIANNKNIATIIKRKYFHLMVIAIFVPLNTTNANNLKLIYVAFAVILCIFIYVETSRLVFRFKFFESVIDAKDEYLILTHIYLLLGCSLPLWLSLNINLEINSYIGIVMLGVGDTMSSVIGYNYGRNRLQNGKSIHGLVAETVSIFFFSLWYYNEGDGILVYKSTDLVFFFLVSFLPSLFETITNDIDNLVVPLYSVFLVNTLKKLLY